jgi:trk system potassium uptake protein TrkA
MYIVIIGCGRLGSTLARELSSEGHDISIIDNDNENLDRLGSGFNGQRIRGVEFEMMCLLMQA